MEAERLKLIDFNISKRKEIKYEKNSKDNMKMLTHFGTIEFSAPEMLEGYNEYSEQVDLWSAGVILYYMLSGKLPFTGEQ